MIAGLDLSTKRIGLARPDGTIASLSAHAGAEDPSRRLHELEVALDRAIRKFPPRPELVVLEGYALGSPGRLSLIRLGEIGGVARTLLFRLGIPIVEIQPSTLKRFATGNGSAGKPDMIARAIETGAPARVNDDEADAWHLRRLGRLAYGLEDGKRLPHELEVLEAHAWPILEPAAVVIA